MPPLAETQAAIAKAILTGRSGLAPSSLVGGGDAPARLGVHLRHYRASLQSALHDKFPATAWLLGGELLGAAAAAYVRTHPPQAPCIAEYGRSFPTFVAGYERARALPYVASFAALEWALGCVSIAVTETPMVWNDIVTAGSDALLDARLVLQSGVRYLHATHGVDELMRLYLNDQEPETFSMPPRDTYIEVRGSRGAFRMTCLDSGDFAFRDALHRGKSVSEAAERALDTGSSFDAGKALRDLVHAGLVSSNRVQ